MSELTCPGCAAAVDERRLVATCTVVEACPACGAVVREGAAGRFTDAAAVTAADVAAVEAWLAAEREAGVIRRDPAREHDPPNTDRWAVDVGPLPGGQPGWSCEVVYDRGVPHVVTVRLSAEGRGWMADAAFAAVRAVCHDHALEPHGSRERGFDAAGPFERSRYGVRQVATADGAAGGRLRPLVRRLAVAMRDVETGLRRAAGD